MMKICIGKKINTSIGIYTFVIISNYGPPSVASSYAEDQQMSRTDYHQKSYQDDQWAKATGQDISQNFEVRHF